ncbi:MAG: cobyric acid synthase [Bacillota bacterium]|nr:cobyric acid synthase [Bacillota bacterium]
MGKLMIYGTTSSAGKSLLTTGLCRILSNKGYKVAPFKSQNMSRNFYTMADGKLIAAAQVLQAQAARIDLDPRLNPIVLVPKENNGSEVYVMGEKVAYMKAKEYFAYKKNLGPKIQEVYQDLKKDYEVIIIEGAGSPAEINLLENDFVNTGMADIADSNCILVTDINRGGAFAHLYGTVKILDPKDAARIKGFVINKFRGDKSLLDSAIKQIEDLTGIPVLGVLDYKDYSLPDEDSLVDGRDELSFASFDSEQLDQELNRLAQDLEDNLDMDKLMELIGL